MFDFVAGALRWTSRVNAYAMLLMTDRYPPFRPEIGSPAGEIRAR